MSRVVAPGATPSRPFEEAARAGLADPLLRRNLRTATSTIRQKRASVVAELPDWEELRAAGAAIKDRALGRLDQHLEALEGAVESHGGRVHWASDGAEACRIVAALTRDAGADEVVKVKSITTDEIGLNDALSDEGITAVETDLGEWILQLAGEKPSHLIAPAIHKTREAPPIFPPAYKKRNA